MEMTIMKKSKAVVRIVFWAYCNGLKLSVAVSDL